PSLPHRAVEPHRVPGIPPARTPARRGGHRRLPQRPVGGLHLLRPRRGSPRPRHLRHPQAGGTGPPPQPALGVPGLLDRRPSEDGLQATLPTVAAAHGGGLADDAVGAASAAINVAAVAAEAAPTHSRLAYF